MTKFFKSELVGSYYGFLIYKEWDKDYDPFTEKFSGHAKVFYTVIDPSTDEMLDSFKTLREAKKFIEKIL